MAEGSYHACGMTVQIKSIIVEALGQARFALASCQGRLADANFSIFTSALLPSPFRYDFACLVKVIYQARLAP